MFRTEVIIPKSTAKISLKQPIFCLGSCFAEVVGERLAQNKFNSLVNPFGVIYNPYSLLKLLEYALKEVTPGSDTYLKNEGIYYNYDLHSSFSHSQLASLQETIEQAIEQTAEYLKKADWLIFTLGTAYIYRRQDNQQIVANCHKMPGHLFHKELLSTEDILKSFDRIFALLDRNGLTPKIILTISPVRHVKSGLVGNNLSKSLLRLAAQQLIESNDGASYFPAYEIMLDDLRGYRFYEKDLVHPNEVAKDYIWQKFIASFFDPQATEFIKNWSKIRSALTHRPFHPESKKHQTFLRKSIALLESLKNQANVTEEMEAFQNQLV